MRERETECESDSEIVRESNDAIVCESERGAYEKPRVGPG